MALCTRENQLDFKASESIGNCIEGWKFIIVQILFQSRFEEIVNDRKYEDRIWQNIRY